MALTGVNFALDVAKRYLNKTYGPPTGKLDFQLSAEVCVAYPGGWKVIILALLPHGEEMIVIKYDESSNMASLDQYGRLEPTYKDIDGYLSIIGM